MCLSFLRTVAPVLALALVVAPASARQEDPHGATVSVADGVDYRIYDREGQLTSLEAIARSVQGGDVLLVGEEHDDMVGHALETLLFTRVFQEIGSGAGAGRPVILSLEMFERDVQYILDEYLAGLVTETHFLRSARPWDDYESRYRPLIEHAKAFGTPVVAANAPRRYVNRVTNEGPESLASLSDQALAFLPPLPYPGPSDRYRQQWDDLMTAAMLGMEADAEEGDASTETTSGSSDDGEAPGDERSARPEMNPNAIHAQALWDASMGHAITQALVRRTGAFVVHLAGSFHVERGTGIPERIADYRPGTRVTSVVMTKVEDIEAWSADEYAELGDFVILTRAPDAENPHGGR